MISNNRQNFLSFTCRVSLTKVTWSERFKAALLFVLSGCLRVSQHAALCFSSRLSFQRFVQFVRVFRTLLFLSFSSLAFADLSDSTTKSPHTFLKTKEKTNNEDKNSKTTQIASKNKTDEELDKKVKKTTYKKKSRAEKKALWHQDMPVRFGSNNLSGFRSNGLLYLEEKVWIHQGDLNLTADKATVYFYPKSESVDKVIVEGNTTITKSDLKTNKKVSAKSNKASFFIQKKELVLEGEAILTRGSEVVAGDRINYNLDSGEIIGSGVRGVVNPSSDSSTQQP